MNSSPPCSRVRTKAAKLYQRKTDAAKQRNLQPDSPVSMTHTCPRARSYCVKTAVETAALFFLLCSLCNRQLGFGFCFVFFLWSRHLTQHRFSRAAFMPRWMSFASFSGCCCQLNLPAKYHPLMLEAACASVRGEELNPSWHPGQVFMQKKRILRRLSELESSTSNPPHEPQTGKGELSSLDSKIYSKGSLLLVAFPLQAVLLKSTSGCQKYSATSATVCTPIPVCSGQVHVQCKLNLPDADFVGDNG